jgi:uncharacterized protein YcbX
MMNRPIEEPIRPDLLSRPRDARAPRRTTASRRTLAHLNPAATWDVRRFRPNLVIATTEALEGLVEANGHGRTLRLREVAVRGERPTTHRAMTLQARGDLPHDPTILRTIVREAGQQLGIYANVVRPGRVAVGDVVDVR